MVLEYTSRTQVLVIELLMSNKLNNSKPAVNSLKFCNQLLVAFLLASTKIYETPKSARLYAPNLF